MEKRDRDWWWRGEREAAGEVGRGSTFLVEVSTRTPEVEARFWAETRRGTGCSSIEVNMNPGVGQPSGPGMQGTAILAGLPPQPNGGTFLPQQATYVDRL